MPGKHVHFVQDVGPSTPSPSYSTSTLPSSPGALTPPSLGFGSPYHCAPLPPTHSPSHYHHHASHHASPSHSRHTPPAPTPTPPPNTPVFIHRALAPHAPLITNDLTLPPSHVTPLPSSPPLSPALFSEPATNPRLPYLLLQCTLLPYTFTITPRDASRSYITVGDLLYGIYEGLRTRVLPNELRAQGAEVRGVVDRAWRARYKAEDGEGYEREKEAGPRRVDFLGGRKVFRGMQMSAGGEGVRWMVLVGEATP